jgi:hypothetical protein
MLQCTTTQHNNKKKFKISLYIECLLLGNNCQECKISSDKNTISLITRYKVYYENRRGEKVTAKGHSLWLVFSFLCVSTNL